MSGARYSAMRQQGKRAHQWYAKRGLQIWGFAFRASLDRIERLCERFLNRDASGQLAYVPLAPFALFTFSASNVPINLRSGTKRLRRGVEWELAIAVPVRRRDSISPLLFMPYVFTNDPVAAVEGREIYGFPKEIAFIRPEKAERGFAVEAYVVNRLDPKAVGQWGQVLKIRRAGERDVREGPWDSFATAAVDLRRLLLQQGSAVVQPDTATALLADFWPPNARFVQLKQFPDCADGRYPCYSSLVEVASKVTDFRGAKLLEGDYRLHLPDMASHPLIKDLGLRQGDPAVLSYQMACGVELDPGEEVWRAPRESLGAPPPTLFQTITAPLTTAQQRISNLARIAFGKISEQILPPESPRSSDDEEKPTRRRGREKIAILGGGVGAMAAAFELTREADWQKRYDITVYQMGWRLGGKGASGRAMDERSKRIEEHGLHIWFGFYENAFRMMRECFRELPELEDWPDEADPIRWGFEPHDQAMLEELVENDWRHHPVDFETRPDEAPGTGTDAPPNVAGYIRMILARMADNLTATTLEDILGDEGGKLAKAARPFVALSAKLMSYAPTEWLEVTGELAAEIIDTVDPLMDRLWRRIAPLYEKDDRLRRFFVAMDFGAAVVRGLVRDDVIERGFDAIDEDLGEWLVRHGARKETLSSDWVRSLAGSNFSFPKGDAENPRAAAGPAIRWALRLLLTYRGAFLWRMKSGMGDIVFASLFRVLKKRGVKFKFFHRVRELHLSRDRKSIDRIGLSRQATPLKGYRYLHKIKEQWCWPNRPDYVHLAEATKIEAVRKEPGAYVNFESAWSSWDQRYEDHPPDLRRGVDFDKVVLGISLGALRPICRELERANDRWRAMLDNIPTVRTQSFQLWLKPTLAQSGYAYDKPPIMTAYARPFETWGDLTLTLPTENWPVKNAPGQVAYVCGPMRDSPEPEPFTKPSFPGEMRALVEQAMRDFLAKHTRHLWPAVTGPDGLPAEQVVDSYCVANIDPSERYVLTTPGSVRHRLPSDDSGFDNLVLAGDWTFNGLNIGCVEAAVMSGRRAAAAIAGRPAQIVGEEHLAEAPGESHRV